MNLKATKLAFVLIIISTLILEACQSSSSILTTEPENPESQSSLSKSKAVGISLPTEADERWVIEGEVMKESLEDSGYTVWLEYAGNKADRQLAQIQDILAKGVNILIITPVDSTVFRELLDAAHKIGVLVIAYDRLITQTKDIDFFVTYNHYEGGVLLGKQIEQALNLTAEKGPYNLEIFSGDPADPIARAYYEGSMSVLKPYIDADQLIVQSNQITFDQTAIPGWNDVTAQVRVNKLLGSYYDRMIVDAILSPSDHLSQGILSGLKKAGYGETNQPLPVITGIGAEVKSIQSIIAGEQTFTILIDYNTLAKQSALMVQAIFQGQRVPVNNTSSYYNGEKYVPTLELSPVWIDKTNYRDLLINSGYFSPEQINELSEK